MLLQLVVAPHCAVLGVRPDLPLLLATSWGLLRGPRWGAIWGLGMGVLLDVLAGVPVGVFTVGLAVAGLLSGLGEGHLFRTHFLLPIGVTVLGTLIYYFCGMAVMAAMDWPVHWGDTFTRVVAPAIAFNVVLTPAVFAFARWAHRLTQEEQIGW